MSDTVFIKKVTGYGDQDSVDTAAEDILLGCGIDMLLRDKKNIVLKPNLLTRANPGEAVTTSPAVMRAVIAALKRRGVERITIADSPGGSYGKAWLKSVYGGCGFLPLEEIGGVSLNYDTESRMVDTGKKRVKRFEIIRPICDADLIITVGRLKTHAMSGMTAAVKNLFGCVPGLKKAEWHCLFPKREMFCEMLIDLAEQIRPQISIVDGIVGMEGDGPSGGTPRNYGILAGSNNPYHLDYVLARYIGMTPDEALTVGASIRRGLCPALVDDIDVAGDTALMEKPITDLKKPRSAETDLAANLPKPLRRPVRALMNGMAARPVIQKKRCVGCGRCKEICPQQVISLAGKKAVIGRKNCIRCFCCHEICPERAIDIRRSFVWGM